jgi:Gas vesicle protein G
MAVIIDSLLVGGIRFVLDKIASAVEGEMNDEGSLREELLAAQMRFELGEIEEDELAEIETAVMARLREIRANREGEGGGGAMGVPSGARVVGVDVTFGNPDDPDER